MTKPVVTYKGVVKAEGFEGAVSGEVDGDDVTVGTAIVDGEATIVLATDNIAEALQKIVDWADAEFTRAD